DLLLRRWLSRAGHHWRIVPRRRGTGKGRGRVGGADTIGRTSRRHSHRAWSSRACSRGLASAHALETSGVRTPAGYDSLLSPAKRLGTVREICWGGGLNHPRSGGVDYRLAMATSPEPQGRSSSA